MEGMGVPNKQQPAGEPQGDFVPLTSYVPQLGRSFDEEKFAGSRDSQPSKDKRPRRKRWLFFALIVLLILAGVALVVRQQSSFSFLLQGMRRNTYFDGVYINGVPVGGLTVEQAREMLSPVSQKVSPELTVDIGGTLFKLSSQALGLKDRLDDTLLEAFSIGRRNTGNLDGRAPFEERVREIRLAKENGAYFYTKVVYDQRKVRLAASQISTAYYVPPKDASIISYNKDTGEIITRPEEKGMAVDEETLYQALVSALDAGNLQAPIQVAPIVSVPKTTQVELRNRFSCLSSFSLKVNSLDPVKELYGRISGLSLLPGQSFSLNEHLGMYSNTRAASEVATSLMHAGLMAGLGLKERWPSETLPSGIEAGLEASVSIGQKDLVLYNPLASPVFFVFDSKRSRTECMVFGTKDDSGLRIHVQAELDHIIPCNTMPLYRENPALEVGQTKRISSPVNGRVVNTYLIKTRGDTVVDKQLIFISRYEPVRAIVEYH